MELFCATVILLGVGGAWFGGVGELAFHLCAFKMSYNMYQLIFFFKKQPFSIGNSNRK